MPYAQKSESEHSIPRWLSRQGWLCLFGRALSLSPSLSLNVISRWQLISSHPRMTRTFQRYQSHPNGEADKCYVNYDLLLWWGWGQESHTILKTLLGWLDSALNKSFFLSPPSKGWLSKAQRFPLPATLYHRLKTVLLLEVTNTASA